MLRTINKSICLAATLDARRNRSPSGGQIVSSIALINDPRTKLEVPFFMPSGHTASPMAISPMSLLLC